MIQQTTALWLAALAIAAATRRSRARLAMGWVAAAPLCLALSPIASAQPVPDDPRYTEIGQHDPEKGTLQGSPTDEGLNYGFNTRGTGAGQNTVTVDGQLMPSLGTSRAFELQSITGTMFEALELTKGHRPDQNADSLGGTLNLKTRSPLSMRDRKSTRLNSSH